MPERCVDASLAVKWVLKGEVLRKKSREFLLASLSAGFTLIAPPLYEYETESVLQLYDSLYASLAELRGCEFWTADRVFFDAVRVTLPFVRHLSEFP